MCPRRQRCAFISIKVATTISSGIVETGVLDLRTLFVVEASAASTLLSASYFGYPLAPAAGASAAAVLWAADSLGSGAAGTFVLAIVAALAAAGLFFATQRNGAVWAADV
jgi:hypothetical protein